MMIIAIIMGAAFYGLGYQYPMSVGEYAPPAAYFHQGDMVHLEGRLVYANGSPAANITVGIYATDELRGEECVTVWNGRFVTYERYEAGQMIRVSRLVWVADLQSGIHAEWERLGTVFVDYEADSDRLFFLGEFVIQ